MLYILALSFGTMDAFFYPASITIIPRLVASGQLRIANALLQGTLQLSQLAGPVLAGGLIAFLGNSPAHVVGGQAVPDLEGVGLAFAFDAFTFLVVGVTLWIMQLKEAPDANQAGVGMFSSIREGLLGAWNDSTLRSLFLLIGGMNVLIVGPIMVGIPVLADTRFPAGAAAYGIIMSAYGGGSLLGTLGGGILPRPRPAALGPALLAVTSILGVGTVVVGFAGHMWLAALAAFVMGLANGYVSIMFITWLQNRTPQYMLGRIMSLLMFASVGLLPVSMALSGTLIDINFTWFMATVGSLFVVVVFLASFSPSVRHMGISAPNNEDPPAA